jgi:hypothetical protein
LEIKERRRQEDRNKFILTAFIILTLPHISAGWRKVRRE